MECRLPGEVPVLLALNILAIHIISLTAWFSYFESGDLPHRIFLKFNKSRNVYERLCTV